jgi:hypothetical protein
MNFQAFTKWQITNFGESCLNFSKDYGGGAKPEEFQKSYTKMRGCVASPRDSVCPAFGSLGTSAPV